MTRTKKKKKVTFQKKKMQYTLTEVARLLLEFFLLDITFAFGFEDGVTDDSSSSVRVMNMYHHLRDHITIYLSPWALRERH